MVENERDDHDRLDDPPENGAEDDSAHEDEGSEGGGEAEAAGTVEEREAIARDEDGPFD